MGAKKEVSRIVTFQPFENLKAIIERRGIEVPPRPAAKKEETVTDEQVFLEAMKEVREIEAFRKIPFRRKGPLPVRRSTSSDREALKEIEEIVAGRRPVNLPDTPEYVEWVSPAYKRDIVCKLREGRFSVQDCLDLHGLVLSEAEEEVERFLGEAMRRRLRCVKIIHGRGLRSPSGPVLKEAVIKWLTCRYRKSLIAFVSARQCDGGLGALYLLFR